MNSAWSFMCEIMSTRIHIRICAYIYEYVYVYTYLLIMARQCWDSAARVYMANYA